MKVIRYKPQPPKVSAWVQEPQMKYWLKETGVIGPNIKYV